jgi:hypothetical protein
MPRRKIPSERKEELRRVVRLLATKIRDADLTFREVSLRLGWQKDRLSHVLKGRLLLRFEDLYAILELLDIPPVEFFAELGRTDPRRDPALGSRDSYEVLPGGLTRSELFAEIRRAIRHELAIREQQKLEAEQEDGSAQRGPTKDPGSP